MATWYLDDGDTVGVLDFNDTLLRPYQPGADLPIPEDYDNRCIDFGAGTLLEFAAGETLSLLGPVNPPSLIPPVYAAAVDCEPAALVLRNREQVLSGKGNN